MGVVNIYFTKDTKLEYSEIKLEFLKQQYNDEYDAYVDNVESTYSGGFNTLYSVKLYDKVFDSFQEAYDYCLANSKKRDFALATYFLNNNKVSTIIAGWGAC